MSFFFLKLKNVSCEYDRLNGWNSTLQAAWYIRHVRIIWFLRTKPTIWLLILSFTQNIVRACSMFYHEGYRSVNPLDAARVNTSIFHNHSVHWYYITPIKGGDYIKHDMNIRHGKHNPRRGRWLQYAWYYHMIWLTGRLKYRCRRLIILPFYILEIVTTKVIG